MPCWVCGGRSWSGGRPGCSGALHVHPLPLVLVREPPPAHAPSRSQRQPRLQCAQCGPDCPTSFTCPTCNADGTCAANRCKYGGPPPAGLVWGSAARLPLPAAALHMHCAVPCPGRRPSPVPLMVVLVVDLTPSQPQETCLLCCYCAMLRAAPANTCPPHPPAACRRRSGGQDVRGLQGPLLRRYMPAVPAVLSWAGLCRAGLCRAVHCLRAYLA